MKKQIGFYQISIIVIVFLIFNPINAAAPAPQNPANLTADADSKVADNLKAGNIDAKSDIKTKEEAGKKVESDANKQLDQIFVHNQAEFDELLKKYSKPIPFQCPKKKGNLIKGQAKLTKETLFHVFGMKISKRNAELNNLFLSGFHHDYKLQLTTLIQPFYNTMQNTGGLLEGFIAYAKNQFPVFKTYFLPSHTREEVIQQLIESLKNILACEDQDKEKLVLIGKTTKGIVIKTVLSKKTKQIITFFPVTQKTKEEIAEEQNKLNVLFKKFFFNVAQRTERKVITKEEVERLVKLYSKGIEVNWVFNGNSILKYDPKKNYPNQKIIKKINITPKSLERSFSQKNDSNFPKYLSKIEILNKLKEALENVVPHKAMAVKTNSMNEINGNFIMIQSHSNGKDISDIYKFLIYINEDNGDLEFFFTLFG